MPPKGRHWRYSQKILTQLEKGGLIHWSKNGVPRKIIYAEDFSGKKVQDIWEFKDKPNPLYPTEKPIDLLKRIIRASSNKGSLVMDCFCGSGSFLQASEELGRRWIGIDASKEAIRVFKKRIEIEEPNKINVVK